MLCRQYGILGEHRDGGYAEFVVVPARNVLPLPHGLSFAEAAALPLVFLTAWHMLVARARLQPFEDVCSTPAASGYRARASADRQAPGRVTSSRRRVATRS